MLAFARPSGFILSILLAAGLALASCSRETAAPAGSIIGAMAPVATAGKLLSVTATATGKNGQAYTVIPDPITGAFSFPTLPPGSYTVGFITTASNPFPVQVLVTVVAGVTATPQIPLITHDGTGRGTFKWVGNGKAYAATDLILVRDAASLFITGQSGKHIVSPEVNSLMLIVPEKNYQSKVFVGVGNYPMGDGGQLFPFATYQTSFYTGSNQTAFYTYRNDFNAPGIIRITRYNSEQGIVAGTFEFVAINDSGTSGPLTVVSGEFDVTF